MKAQINEFPFKHLIVLDAAGTMDLAASKAALRLLVTSPGFESSNKVLLDLRGVECELSTTDIFDLALFMSQLIAAHHVSPRIAVLAAKHQPGHLAFNRAQFLELCADNRGLDVHAFEDGKAADEWLNSQHPPPPAAVCNDDTGDDVALSRRRAESRHRLIGYGAAVQVSPPYLPAEFGF